MGLNRRRPPLRRCGLLLALALLGCGRDDKPMPVHGRVFYRGQPLPGGTIVFAPDPERGGRGPLACGEIGADGHYSLHTGDTPGAVPGWHRVTIAASSADSQAEMPRKYSDPEQSGLLREVKPGVVAEQDFYLEQEQSR
jgi:hypothetical protein